MADVTVKLTVGSFSAEVTGPAEYVDNKLEEIITRFLAGSRSSSLDIRTAAVGTEATGKRLSASEFLRKVDPSNQSDIALLLGYYIEHVESKPNYTSTEIASLGKEAKRPFGNASDVVAKLTARGLMMSAGDKDGQRAYSLTATGEQYVESMIDPT